QSVWLYFGNPKAAPASDASSTFDSATSLVLHFSNRDGLPLDASSFARPVADSSAQSIVDGFIDGAARFTAASRIRVTDARGLQFGAGGFTLSGWVRFSKAGQRAVLAAIPEDGSGLWLGVEDGRLTAKLGGVRAQARAELAAGAW